MSIYATFFVLDGEEHENECPALNSLACKCSAINNMPLVYNGSHITPARGDKRGGDLDLSTIPPHIGDEEKEKNHHDFLRVGMTEELSKDSAMGIATILLETEQVIALRDNLTSWLERGTEW